MAKKRADDDPAYVLGKVEAFEKAGEKVVANKNKVVMKNAAARQVMISAGEVAELCELALKDNTVDGRDHLVAIWGGSCEKLCRLLAVLETVEPELDAGSAGQQHSSWLRAKNNIQSVKKVLEDMGKFKAWNPQLGSQPPSSISYRSKKRYAPGEKIDLRPDCEGGDPSEFKLEGQLPKGLKFDPRSGAITGRISPDCEMPETTFTVRAINDRGEASTALVFGVGPDPPSDLAYNVPPEVYIGEAGFWKPTYEPAGAAKTWDIGSSLPKGFEFHAEDGVIAGIAAEVTAEKTFTVTAGNVSGKATCDVKFAVKAAPPISLSYNDQRPEYFKGQMLRLTPDLLLKKAAEGNILAAFARKTRVTQSGAGPGAGEGKLASKLRQAAYKAAGVQFSVSPALPDGVAISPSTGVISGTPKEPQEKKVYTVTATNGSGHVSCDVPMFIRISAPENLVYTSDPILHTGEPVSLSPTVDGVVTQFTCEPPLPSGLRLDAETGVISGNPTTVTPAQVYKITAANDMGQCTFDLPLEIQRAAPKNLQYLDVADQYPKLRPLSLLPTVEGENLEFSVIPSLPAGLSLDSATGTISGTPTEIKPKTNYKVTAKNETGSCDADVCFEVLVLPPTDLRYERVDDRYNIGETVCEPTGLEPTVQGGVDEFSIQPALPEGLSFDTKTGVISGSPKTRVDETDYTVTASNEGGGTSCVITFAVVPLPPMNLAYNGVKDVEIEKPIEKPGFEPDDSQCLFCTYSVTPPLPPGIILDPDTGVISGSCADEVDTKEYVITAKNECGSTDATVEFAVTKKSNPDEADEDFCRLIDECTDIADCMNLEPKTVGNYGNWMVWMVHRAFLNDPTLKEFNFSTMPMPLPHIQWRVAPKLMEALESNTCIETLLLASSNLRRTQGEGFAKALNKNTSLKIVDVASNDLDQEGIKMVAEALKQNEATKVETLRFASNGGIDKLGAPTEAAISEMMKSNKTICTLGCSLNNPGYRDLISRALLKNGDIRRRQRKAAGGGGSAPVASAAKKSLKAIVLNDPPSDKSSFEVFPADNEQLAKAKEFLVEKRVVPNAQALQKHMKDVGCPIGFSAVGPLLKDLRGKLLDSCKGHDVSCADTQGYDTTGVLKEWSEKNRTWALDVWVGSSKRFNFETSNDPEIRLGDKYATWLI